MDNVRRTMNTRRHDGGRQHIAMNNLSHSGDLKSILNQVLIFQTIIIHVNIFPKVFFYVKNVENISLTWTKNSSTSKKNDTSNIVSSYWIDKSCRFFKHVLFKIFLLQKEMDHCSIFYLNVCGFLLHVVLFALFYSYQTWQRSWQVAYLKSNGITIIGKKWQ